MMKSAIIDKCYKKVLIEGSLPDQCDTKEWTSVIKRRIIEKLNLGAVCPQWFEAMEQDIDNFLSSGSTSFKFSNDCHNLQVYPNITLLTNHFEHICWLVNYLATPFDAYLPI